MLAEPLLQRLAEARHVVALTGAGISAESGVPTFRDAQTGLWARYRAEELATPAAFLAEPRLVWDWYAWRRSLTRRAQPNAGHAALVQLERLLPRLTLITQNVDGLHARAGSRNVLELHGNLDTTLCFDEGTVVTEYTDDGRTPPRCPRCGGLLRPGVVWFGESLPKATLEQAEVAAASCDVLLSVGTSSLVHPAAGLPLAAKRHGAVLLEVNPTATPLTPHVDAALSGPAGLLLPELARQLERLRGRLAPSD
ncbi:MAG: NAD-dependent deacylase [Myxococcales bacterium]|nr:MAG: NAD-dependent deacylase [Myxococcales bacterium]